MGKSVIILAGGSSERFGQRKAFADLIGRPLISHVFENVQGMVDEVLIVVSSAREVEPFLRLFDDKVRVIVDEGEPHSPLVGASAGFESASGDYSLLLPCDAPFVSRDVSMILFDMCLRVDAAIPRWPNGYIEPLQTVYRTESAAHASKMALSEKRMDMRSMISFLRRVRYVSTIVLRKVDPYLDTFFNVNTKLDLKEAERIKRSRR